MHLRTMIRGRLLRELDGFHDGMTPEEFATIYTMGDVASLYNVGFCAMMEIADWLKTHGLYLFGTTKELRRFDIEGLRCPRVEERPSIANIGINIELRDWFAGEAMEGLLANPALDLGHAALADDAYKQADAMLEARKR